MARIVSQRLSGKSARATESLSGKNVRRRRVMRLSAAAPERVVEPPPLEAEK